MDQPFPYALEKYFNVSPVSLLSPLKSDDEEKRVFFFFNSKLHFTAQSLII